MAYHLHNKYHHHQNTSTSITNCKNREKNCIPESALKCSDIVEGSQTHSPPAEDSQTHSPPVEGSQTHSPPAEESQTHSPPVEGPQTHSPPVEGSQTHSPPVHFTWPYHSPFPNYSLWLCSVFVSILFNPYPTAFPYGNGMVLHFYQQQESSMTKTVHRVINKGLKAYV